jgi:hypothetical protein
MNHRIVFETLGLRFVLFLIFSIRVDSWNIAHIQPSSGSAKGWERLTISGSNFNGVQWNITFSDRQNNSYPILSDAINVIDDSTITILTPTWDFPSVSNSANITVTSSSGTSSTTSSSFNFEYRPFWFLDSTAPTAGPASGGTVLTFQGLGFSSQDSFRCQLQLITPFGNVLQEVNTPANFVSSITLNSTTPVWSSYARPVRISLQRLTADLGWAPVDPRENFALFEYQEIWFVLNPVKVGAVGDMTISITGLGFDPAISLLLPQPYGLPLDTEERGYIMQFLAAGLNLNSTLCTVASVELLICPSVESPISTVANVSLFKVWTLPSQQYKTQYSSIVNLVNTTESTAQLTIVAEWTSIFPTVGDKLGGTVVTVAGRGFVENTHYTCLFSSPESNMSVSSQWISSQIIVCNKTETWSLQDWKSYDTSNTVFSMREGDKIATLSAKFSNSTFEFVYINKAPVFKTQFDFTTFLSRAISVSDWDNVSIGPVVSMADVSPGLSSDGAPAVDELSQNWTFTVRSFPDKLFAKQPTLDNETGNISFQVNGDLRGVAVIHILLEDNGGTRNGGVNSSGEKLLAVRLQDRNLVLPSFVLSNSSLVFDENSGPHMFPDIIQNIFPGTLLLQSFYETVVSVIHGPEEAFQNIRLFPNETLLLHSAPFFYGQLTVQITLKIWTFSTQPDINFTSTSKNISVEVLFVNNPPSFDLKNDSLIVWEGSDLLNISLFANISHGSPTGNEDDQNLTFALTIVRGRELIAPDSYNSSSSIFSSMPTVIIGPNASDAKLSFAVNPYWAGIVTVEAVLVDTGGTERGGQNTSAAKAFNISVLPVNHAPSFQLLHKNQLKISMGAGRVSLPWVGNVSRGSPTGNEDYQNLTFVITYSVGRLVATAPSIVGNSSVESNVSSSVTRAFSYSGFPTITLDANGRSGNLSFAFEPSWYGDAEFSVVLVDSGGRDRSGADTSPAQTFNVTVLPVNQAPTFDLVSPTVTVLEGAGPSTRVFAVNISSGVTAIETDHSNLTFVLLPASMESNATSLVAFADGGAPKLTLNGDRKTANLTFTATPFWYGTVSYSVFLLRTGDEDVQGARSSVTAHFNLSVLSVNHAPTFDLLTSSVTVSEGPGRRSVALFTNVSRGSPLGNEDQQSVTFHVVRLVGGSPDPQRQHWVEFTDDGFPSVVLNADGRGANLSFALQRYWYGTQHLRVWLTDSGGTERGGKNVSVSYDFNLTVTGVNQAPSFDLATDAVSVLEGSGQTSVLLAVNMSKGSPTGNEDYQDLFFYVAVGSDVSSSLVEQMFASGGFPAVALSSSGLTANLTFALTEYGFGSASFLVVLQDSGGVEFGGANSSAGRQVNISVLPVNQAPTYELLLPSISVLEGSGRVSFQLLGSVSAGSPTGNENEQTLTFIVKKIGDAGVNAISSSSSGAEFASMGFPEVSLNGDQSTADVAFEFQTAWYGKVFFTIAVADSGGTARGGRNTSVLGYFDITAVAVDHAPRFDLMMPVVTAWEGASLTNVTLVVNISTGSPYGIPNYDGLSFVI